MHLCCFSQYNTLNYVAWGEADWRLKVKIKNRNFREDRLSLLECGTRLRSSSVAVRVFTWVKDGSANRIGNVEKGDGGKYRGVYLSSDDRTRPTFNALSLNRLIGSWIWLPEPVGWADPLSTLQWPCFRSSPVQSLWLKTSTWVEEVLLKRTIQNDVDVLSDESKTRRRKF